MNSTAKRRANAADAASSLPVHKEPEQIRLPEPRRKTGKGGRTKASFYIGPKRRTILLDLHAKRGLSQQHCFEEALKTWLLALGYSERDITEDENA